MTQTPANVSINHKNIKSPGAYLLKCDVELNSFRINYHHARSVLSHVSKDYYICYKNIN
jgi:hypothetical protein